MLLSVGSQFRSGMLPCIGQVLAMLFSLKSAFLLPSFDVTVTVEGVIVGTISKEWSGLLGPSLYKKLRFDYLVVRNR